MDSISIESPFVPQMTSRANLNDIDPSVFAGKVVMVRVDYNCPLNYSKNNHHGVNDDSKIRASIDTIQFLRNHGAKTVILSHLGRPDAGTKPIPPLTPILDQLLENREGSRLLFCSFAIGRERHAMIKSMNNCDVLLLENVRFYREDIINDPLFSQALAEDVDIFVNEAFSSAHRAHSSTFGIKEYLEPYQIAVAGFDFENEVNALESCISNIKRPAVALLGGLKCSTKLSVLRSLIRHVDKVLIGGAVAFTFLKALGFQVGSSLVDESSLGAALEIQSEARRLGVKIIISITITDCNAYQIGSLDQNSNLYQVFDSSRGIPDGWRGMDIGPDVMKIFRSHLDEAATIIFNGPMGAFETQGYDLGTSKMIHSIINLTKTKGILSIACGGETAAAVEAVTHQSALHTRNMGFSHLSLGGSAALSLLSNLRLPGVDILSFTSSIPESMRVMKLGDTISDPSAKKVSARSSLYSEGKNDECGTIGEK
eukprot:GSChrysophyteH1.ASY1.ANO1.2746.1 assembled CDS